MVKLNSLWKSVQFLLMMTLICGVVYTGLITAVAQCLFPEKASGSMIEVDGKKYGCALLGQPYADEAHLWGRVTKMDVSTFTDEKGNRLLYGAPSNLSPASDAYEALIAERVRQIKESNPQMAGRGVPVELVTNSGSGLDPHISPAAAQYQVARIAAKRGMTKGEVEEIVSQCTEGKLWGVLGEDRVNVLRVNLMLDGIL